jgi:copper chaperone CopZ
MKSTLYIQNLKCGGCEATIIEKLSKLKNITNVSVNQQYDTVTFEYMESSDLELVKKELSKLGYPPFGEKNSLPKKVKSYISCAIGRIK